MKWITRYCKRAKIDGLIQKYPRVTSEVVSEGAEKVQLKINVWYQKNYTSPVRLEFEISHEAPLFELNLLSRTFDRFNNINFEGLSLILDINKYLKIRKYDPDNNRLTQRKMTFVQAIATKLYPTLSGNKFSAKCFQIQEKWGSSELNFSEIYRFYKTFGIGLKIFTTKTTGRRRLTKKYDTLWKEKIILQMTQINISKPLKFSEMVNFIYSEDDLNYFECDNGNCYFVTERYAEFETHKESCKDMSEVIYKQVRYEKPDQSTKIALVEEEILPSVNFHNTLFATFDIESLMLPDETTIGPDRLVHRICSVAVATNFGDRRSYFIARKDMRKKSLKFMMTQFIAVLEKAQKDMFESLPQSIQDGFYKYAKITSTEEYKTGSVEYKNNAQRKLAYLRSITSLRTYSWNGERYDLPALLSPLLERLSKDKETFKRLSVIKRSGQSYMEIRFGRILLRDFINHSAPIALEAFAASCGADVTKAAFPYELWYNIRDLEVTKRFPDYDDFFSSVNEKFREENVEELRLFIESSLRNGKFVDLFDVEDFFGWPTGFLRDTFTVLAQNVIIDDSSKIVTLLHTSPNKYAASKDYFDSNCINMLDYLEFYNSLDCELLIQSIEKYTEGFISLWNVNVHDFISLPSLAQYLAFEKYNPEAFPIYSFGNKFGFLNAEIRSQLFGGLVMVFSRLQKVRPEPFTEKEMTLPPSVYSSPDGKRLKNIELFDFNSLVSSLRYCCSKIINILSIRMSLNGACRLDREYFSANLGQI